MRPTTRTSSKCPPPNFPSSAALLLCSDGLSDLITSIQILSIVEQGAGDPVAVTQALIDAANNAGGKDNITVVYVEGDRFAPRSAGDPRPLAKCLLRGVACRWNARQPLAVSACRASRWVRPAVFAFKPYWRITPEGQKLGFGAVRDHEIWRVNSDIGAAIQNATLG